MTFFNKAFIFSIVLLFFYSCGTDVKDMQSSVNKAVKDKSYSQFKTKAVSKSYLRAYDKALALFPIAYEEVDVPTTLGKAHVIISGPKGGETVVLLHGLNASSTMWYPNVKDLSAKYRVYAIDFLLEPGKSVSKRKTMRIEDLVNWYGQIFDYFKLEKINLIGASRGGWMAVNIALSSQARIHKMVLLSPAQTIMSIKPRKKILYNVFFSMFPRRTELRSVLKTLSFNVDKLRQPYIDQYYIAVKHQKINPSILQMTPYSDSELKSLNMPILLLVGDNDIINDTTSIVRAEKLIPHLQSGMIKNSSHFLSFDQPEIIDRKILKFLED